MKNIKQISIAIPVYNEEANIDKLLRSLLKQKESGFEIKEIIVFSDGSTDNSAEKINTIQDNRILFINKKDRLGKSARIDQAFRMFTGDILFLLDADIVISDRELFSKIIEQVDFSHAGLAAIDAVPIKPQNYFETIIETSVLLMKEIAKNWKNGNNYLPYKGCFLGLDRNFAKSVHLDSSLVNNDAFLYFSAVEQGFSPYYFVDAKVYYRSPSTHQDHLKQSSRHSKSQEELSRYFKK